MRFEIKTIDGREYYVDVTTGNKWGKQYCLNGVDDAIKHAETLVNCTNCENCFNCVNCHDCYDCRHCENITKSDTCKFCKDSTSISCCNKVKDCHNCYQVENAIGMKRRSYMNGGAVNDGICVSTISMYG